MESTLNHQQNVNRKHEGFTNFCCWNDYDCDLALKFVIMCVIAVQSFVFFQSWVVLIALMITVFCTEILSAIWYSKQKTVFQKLDFVASSGDKVVMLLPSGAWYKGYSHSLAKMCQLTGFCMFLVSGFVDGRYWKIFSKNCCNANKDLEM